MKMKWLYGFCLLLTATACNNAKKIEASSSSNNKKLVWADEFNYTGLPDAAKWNYEEGFVRNKEPQFYTTKRLQNARVESGNLVLEAKKENYKDAAYTSASIITLGHKTWDHGRMEVRAKVPKGLGVWPAFWMLGEDRGPVKWPDCGEIDIMEFVGKDSALVYGTVHYAKDDGSYGHQGQKPNVGSPYDGFHIYAIDWNKDSISFYYDSLKYFVFDISKAERATQEIFHKKFYLVLNLALGRQGTLGGPLDDKSLPSKYYVDYVRVYQ